jgi:hypothetical protein
MTTITTATPEAAEAEPVEGTVAVRQEPPPQDVATQDDDRPVDGALLWILVRRYLSFYVALPSEAALNLVTAWVFHACARNRASTGIGQLIWQASPRLLILSRKRGAGKSTLLDLIVILTGSRRGKVPRITPARLAQIIGQAHETVCIDEGSLVFGAGRRHLDLQACLLAGYTPRASYEVSKTSLSLFGPVAIATKESLLTEATKAVDGDDSSLGDLIDRCFPVTLEAPARPMPEVGQRAEAEGAALARGLVKWTTDGRAALEQAAQDIADEDYDTATERAGRGEKAAGSPRAFQIGRPLRAIGRVIDQQAREDQERRGIEGGEPKCEAYILAALSGNPGTAATGVMTELESLAQAWEGRAEAGSEDGEGGWDEPGGRIVYDDDYSEPEAAPAARYVAGYAETRPGGQHEGFRFPGAWQDPGTAMDVCEHDAGQQLDWQATPGGNQGASIFTPAGIRKDYAVTMVTGK